MARFVMAVGFLMLGSIGQAFGQGFSSLPLCSLERVQLVGAELTDPIPYIDGESRPDFVRRVFGCTLPTDAAQLFANSRVWSYNVDDVDDVDSVGTLVGWSRDAAGQALGAWVALENAYTIPQNQVNYVGISFVDFSDFQVIDHDRIGIPDHTVDYFVSVEGSSLGAENIAQAILNSFPDADVVTEPSLVSATMTETLTSWYFSDNFVDIFFDTTPNGGFVFVEGAYIASTDVTIQLNNESLNHIEIRNESGSLCEFQPEQLSWVVPGELARFACVFP